MTDLETMARAVDFIETHLQEPIGVGDMALAVSYSLYHFCRTFNHLTGYTPYDYLMRRRVTEAARELTGTDQKIIEIALAYQFNNPETFSRAFKRVLGVQPNQWRRQPSPAAWQLLPPLTPAHLQHWQRNAPWGPAVVPFPELCLVGAAIRLPAATASPEAAWTWLHREFGGAVPGPFYGLIHRSSGGEPEVMYLAGVAGDAALAASRALVLKYLPAGTGVRVTHRGPASTLGLTLDYLYYTWFPQTDYRPTGAWFLEEYGPVPGRSPAESGTWEILIPLAS